MPPEQTGRTRRLRRHLFTILEAGKTGDLASRVFDLTMVALIVANVVMVVLESLPGVTARHGPALGVFEIVSLAIFTLEYAARLWVGIEHRRYQRLGPVRGRLHFALTWPMLIDLAVIAPFYLGLFLGFDSRILRVFRLLRFLKLARFSPALVTLGRVFEAERGALFGALIVMTGILVFAAAIMQSVEGRAQPEAFGTIPDAMWWAVATLTTVGYGDVVPVTVAGKLVGAVVMLAGLGVFALPIGILASGFASEIHRQQFVISWNVVARMPLFSDLDAEPISEIARLMRAEVVSADSYVFRRGEPADALYFIASGEAQIEGVPEPIRLGEGAHFGERALFGAARREESVKALTKLHLLILEADNLRAFLHRNPKVRTRIEETAREKFGEAGALVPSETS